MQSIKAKQQEGILQRPLGQCFRPNNQVQLTCSYMYRVIYYLRNIQEIFSPQSLTNNWYRMCDVKLKETSVSVVKAGSHCFFGRIKFTELLIEQQAQICS